MATVDKSIADRIVAGEFPEDNIVKIVRYRNLWDGDSYGVIYAGQPLDKYQPSDFVREPTTYWEAAA